MLGRVVTMAALAVGGVMLSKKFKGNNGFGASSGIVETIEINVPVSTAYNQFTQFEDFPQFMKSVKEIRQLDDTHLHWRANVAGEEKEWDAEITEQIPDNRIAWRSVTGFTSTNPPRLVGDARRVAASQSGADCGGTACRTS